MKIVLVDDHPLVRKGLKALLEEEPAWNIVGEAGAGAEGVRLITDLQPRVAVLDIKLPDMSGFQVAAATKQRSPETRIIMLSMHADEFHLNEAFRSGAHGYVVKNAMEHEIVDAVCAVTKDGRYVSKRLYTPALGASADPVSLRGNDSYETLTRREREVLCLIAQGGQNKEIAERLFISYRTVEAHRARIMRKLRLRSAGELIHFAIRRNIVSVTASCK